MAKLIKEVREAVAKAETIGWTFTGQIDGQGHPILQHTSGAKHSVPATPGDWRSMKNALAAMERISGQKIERTGKRRASHKGFQGSGFSMEEAKREQADFHRSTDVLPVADLWEQRRLLIADMIDLLKCQSSADQTGQATTLLWKIRATERGLKNLGQSVRDFDLMDLPIPGHIKEAAKASLKPSTPKPDPKIAQLSAKASERATRRKAKVDDFDGTLLLEDTEPFLIEWKGKTYALNLSDTNQAMIEEFMTNLVEGAKVIPKRRKPRPKTPEEIRQAHAERAAANPTAPPGEAAKVRAWLRENGFPDVKDRGRFSAAQIDAWNNRNKRARRLAKSA